MKQIFAQDVFKIFEEAKESIIKMNKAKEIVMKDRQEDLNKKIIALNEQIK